MCNFGVRWAVVAGVTPPIAVWAHLLLKALELRMDGVACASTVVLPLLPLGSFHDGKELPGHSRLFLIIDLNPQMVGFWGFGVLG